MVPSEVDYDALWLIVLKWAAVIFVLYILVLIVLRFSNYYRIARCPNCEGELKRSQRTAGDKLRKRLSFGILPVKRYRCYTCYWEGVALDIRNIKKSQTLEKETD